MSPFETLLENPYAARRYLVELVPYDPATGSEITLYYSDHGFTTEPGDTPANQHFEARVVEALNFQRSLFRPGAIGGASVPDFGEIRLDNTDGGLDFLRTLAFDGRRVTVRLGGDDFAYADYGVIFCGTAQSVVVDEEAAVVRLRDLQSRLTTPVPSSLYKASDPDSLDLVFTIQGGSGNDYLYAAIQKLDPYTFKTDDVIEYEIFWPKTGPRPKQIAVDVSVTLSGGGGATLRASSAVDQNGLAAHPSTDLTPHASGRWYTRSIPVPAAWDGAAAVSWDLACEHDSTGPTCLRARLRNLRVVDSAGTEQFSAWASGDGIPDLDLYLSTDPANALDIQLTSTFEGGEALEGRPRPLCFGVVQNISPVMVNPSYLHYQVHDGEILALDTVYDNGIALTWNPDPQISQYTIDHARGIFTLNQMPTQLNLITADVRGDAGDGYVETVATVVRRLAERYGPAEDPLTFDDASFAELDAANPAPVGLYLTEQQPLSGVLDQLVGAIGTWYGFDRAGTFQVGRFEAPEVATALVLDGIDDHVVVDGLGYDRDDYTELTVEAWVCTTAGGFVASWDRSEYWRLSVEPSGGQVSLRYYDSANLVIQDLVGTASVADGTWHHIAAVLGGGQVTLYIDGAVDSTFSVGSTWGRGGGVVRYGFWGVGSEADVPGGATNAATEYGGKIREGRIWSIARTGSEILAAMNATLSGTEPGLVGYWPFDEGTGSTVRDRTPNRYHATVVSAGSPVESWNVAAVFTPAEILELETEPTELPAWRQRVTWGRSWTLQSADSLAGGTDPDHRDFVGQESRLAVAEDPAIQDVHRLARDPEPVSSLLDAKADAEAEAARLLALYGARRELYRVTVKTQPYRLELGDSVRLDYPRFGLQPGRIFRIVGLEERADTHRVTLELWG